MTEDKTTLITEFTTLGQKCLEVAKAANHQTVSGYVQNSLHYLETATLYIKAALEFSEILEQARKEAEKDAGNSKKKGKAKKDEQPIEFQPEPQEAS